MPERVLRVFPGGMLTIIDRGESDSRKRFRVEWPNASVKELQEIRAFWGSVNGPADSWPFSHAGNVYKSCNFEANSLKIESPKEGGCHRVVVTFRAAHCLICASESARLFDRDLSANLVSIDCPDCGNFRIVATMEPSNFGGDDRRSELRAIIKQQLERLVIRSDWEIRLAQWNRPKPKY